MRKKLDPEGLGIILLNSFMEEFFPKEENPMPDLFSLVHYNGLTQSNLQGQVGFVVIKLIMLFINFNLDKVPNRGMCAARTELKSGERK